MASALELSSACRVYRRREPEVGVLQGVVAGHLQTFLARARADEGRRELPRFVVRELVRFVACGVLAHGFARFSCSSCGKDALVGFSCKGRGFCPSCGGRRMADLAAHLVDRVIPDVPVRQWVLSFPFELRFRMARDPALTRAVRGTFLRTLMRWLERRVAPAGTRRARSGAVNFVQRFGSALNCNIHCHALVLDGAFVAERELERPVFHAAPRLTDEDVAHVLAVVRKRILALLRRRGLLTSDDAAADVEVEEEPSVLDVLCAASIQGRVALGPRAGRALERLGRSGEERPSFVPGELCAEQGGFSLHARVRMGTSERGRASLERVARYIARPAIALDRLSLAPDGRVVWRLRKPFRDGTRAIVFDPLTFLERLAALVPRPRTPQLTYHGVLAPAAAWRDLIVPAPVESDQPRAREEGEERRPRSSRLAWAQLLRRVFELDALVCGHCGGRRKLVALITQPGAIHAILAHLGLPLDPIPLAPARPPPELQFAFE